MAFPKVPTVSFRPAYSTIILSFYSIFSRMSILIRRIWTCERIVSIGALLPPPFVVIGRTYLGIVCVEVFLHPCFGSEGPIQCCVGW